MPQSQELHLLPQNEGLNILSENGWPMICEKCESLFCKCFIEVHKRQPAGKAYSLLTDDNSPHSDAEVERRETKRLYNQKFREEKKRAKENDKH